MDWYQRAYIVWNFGSGYIIDVISFKNLAFRTKLGKVGCGSGIFCYLPFLVYESIDVSFEFFWNCKSKGKQTPGTNEYVKLVLHWSSTDKSWLYNTWIRFGPSRRTYMSGSKDQCIRGLYWEWISSFLFLGSGYISSSNHQYIYMKAKLTSF